MCRAEALSPPHLSVLSSHHCSVHPCLLSVELATRKSLYVLHHAAPCEQLPLLHSQITLIHVSHPSPCTIGIPHSPGSLCWERVHLPQLLTSWKLLLRCPECSVRSPFASPPHPVLCARAPSPPTARARPGPCAAWRGAAPSLLPAAHAALCSGPVAPHAWLFPQCSSPPCAHALAVPCRNPAVGGHAFCCTRALMDAAPPSPPFLSLMLAAVHQCARALMHCCHPSCSPVRRRVLDSPSAHVHALLLLLEPVSAMLSSLVWAHAHGGRRACCGAYAYLLWTSPSV